VRFSAVSVSESNLIVPTAVFCTESSVQPVRCAANRARSHSRAAPGLGALVAALQVGQSIAFDERASHADTP